MSVHSQTLSKQLHIQCWLVLVAEQNALMALVLQAVNLVKAGYDVTVWNRNPGNDLAVARRFEQIWQAN